jgi:hypothetical protein
MKLYVKITSERASNGQGGNNCVNIDLFGEDEDMLARLIFRRDAKADGKYILAEDFSFRSPRLSIHTFKEQADVPLQDKSTSPCDWCGRPAINKEWREIDGITGSTRECDGCANLDTAFLLERQKQRGKKQKGANDCAIDCKHEHLCKGVNCKQGNPHNC